jgi:hypothetical protein
MDRPAIVARVQQHNNDDLVQYLLCVGAAVNQGVVILLL